MFGRKGKTYPIGQDASKTQKTSDKSRDSVVKLIKYVLDDSEFPKNWRIYIGPAKNQIKYVQYYVISRAVGRRLYMLLNSLFFQPSFSESTRPMSTKFSRNLRNR